MFRRVLWCAVLLVFCVMGMFADSAVQDREWVAGVYLTGIMCPFCAEADRVVLGTALEENSGFILLEYEFHAKDKENRHIAMEYFASYMPDASPAVPAFIFTTDHAAIAADAVAALMDGIPAMGATGIPLRDGRVVEPLSLDPASLPGRPVLWHRDRVMFRTEDAGGGTEAAPELMALFLAEDFAAAIQAVPHEVLPPRPLVSASGDIEFRQAVRIGEWVIQLRSFDDFPQYSRKPAHESAGAVASGGNFITYSTLFIVVVFFTLYLFDRRNMIRKGTLDPLSEKQKNILTIAGTLVFLAGFFVFARSLSPSIIQDMGYSLPLPVFTFIIALVDGFNPCNMFVLTFLMALIVSATHSRFRIYVVGYTFIAVVYIVYFLFMAAWLNIFAYIGFVGPLRISIGVIALIAGLINCKELFFFKKGVSLTVSEEGSSFLKRQSRKVRDVIKTGSIPMLIISSVGLAFFASLIELPCTAGFPIVYTSILSGLGISGASVEHYFWLALYNLVYVIPLAVIIFVFGYTFRGKAVSEAAVKRMKFAGGLIMIILAIILLINPAIIGILA